MDGGITMGVRHGGRRGLWFFFFVFAPGVGLVWTDVCGDDVSVGWRVTIDVACTVVLLFSIGRPIMRGLRTGRRLTKKLSR